MNISILDCTLRDGAHLVNGIFGEKNKSIILKSLVDASIDIIEIGFIMGEVYNLDSVYYPSITDAEKSIKTEMGLGQSMFSVMIRPDKFNLDYIIEYKNIVSLIRLAFYYDDLELTINFAIELSKNGYKVSLNPINTPSYSSLQLMELIGKANSIKPYAFSIVDTIGSLNNDNLNHILKIVNKNLDKDIVLGIHLHQNRNAAEHLAQSFMSYKHNRENIIIDSTITGFGRTPGNLPTESLVYNVEQMGLRKYNPLPLFHVIDEVIAEYKKRNLQWGYDPLYYYSGVYGVDRTYAEYFLSVTGSYEISLELISKISNLTAKIRFNKIIAMELLEYEKNS